MRTPQDWSKWKCKRCGAKRKGNHKDVCNSCYGTIQYQTNPAYREKARARARKSQSRSVCKERNKIRGREWRKKYPKKHKISMIKSLVKSLDSRTRVKVMKEMGYVRAIRIKTVGLTGSGMSVLSIQRRLHDIQKPRRKE